MDANNKYTKTNPYSSHLQCFLSLHHCQRTKRSLFALLSLFLLLLLACNGVSMFCFYIPFPAKAPSDPASFSPENVSRKWVSMSSSTKVTSSVMHAVKEENPPAISKSHLTFVHKNHNLVVLKNNPSVYAMRRRRKHKSVFRMLRSETRIKQFSTRLKEFFSGSPSNSSCKFRFFMTWISSLESFGGRELFTVQSVFKSHPNGCLLIASNSMDSRRGMKILRPFWNHGFRVTAISPDFDYLFKQTAAQECFDRLKRGNVDPGAVSLGQNLSNLLRLCLLYKFGGIYIDTDVIVLKSFGNLRNAIGAQTIDLKTRNWSRLNNAVMVFDKEHPLVYKFIEEFALTFDGNKWGHNGPYLVSRVVSRMIGKAGFNFTVLPPVAFYPTDWSRIRSLFQGPRNETHLKWLLAKLEQICRQSYVVHLWNKQSRRLKVAEGSIIGRIMSDCCGFCNSSISTFLAVLHSRVDLNLREKLDCLLPYNEVHSIIERQLEFTTAVKICQLLFYRYQLLGFLFTSASAFSWLSLVLLNIGSANLVIQLPMHMYGLVETSTFCILFSEACPLPEANTFCFSTCGLYVFSLSASTYSQCPSW
ncbi:unnamed protein product [Ilex paraguariensis]|uniref:Alpha 1,4-glycosyltransferase domain-containing protein n=1 Tax=Ilex paraguariensis TaxID=185542 RepID=A0ABC8T5Q6_9AQUA